MFGLFKGKKKLTPELQKAYNQARQAEARRIERTRKEAQIKAIKARARADAARAATPTGKRIAGGLMTAGRAIGKRIDKFDSEKFESFVSGVSTSPKKKK